jgi:uncharacterized protein YukJ
MELYKKQLKAMIANREGTNKCYQDIVNALSRYEDNNVDYYSENDVTKRILTNPITGSEFTEKYNSQIKSLKNPFKEAYYWFKGELLDLKGLHEALIGRENVIKQQASTESKKRSDQVELEKLSHGKTTLKTLFKSKSSKEGDI